MNVITNLSTPEEIDEITGSNEPFFGAMVDNFGATSTITPQDKTENVDWIAEAKRLFESDLA